jgi:peptidoglycan L-alanyl-D-glutamate endopeptidase CwlK
VSLNARSRDRLKGVHPDLVAVVERAAEIGPAFIVTEGLRTVERQKQLLAAGASRTTNSRHITGHAVDLAALVDGKVRWDWPLYHRLAGAMKQAAAERNVAIIWGGDWKSFPDGPHFELNRSVYP